MGGGSDYRIVTFKDYISKTTKIHCGPHCPRLKIIENKNVSALKKPWNEIEKNDHRDYIVAKVID